MPNNSMSVGRRATACLMSMRMVPAANFRRQVRLVVGREWLYTPAVEKLLHVKHD